LVSGWMSGDMMQTQPAIFHRRIITSAHISGLRLGEVDLSGRRSLSETNDQEIYIEP